jgi:hypothetical protein
MFFYANHSEHFVFDFEFLGMIFEKYDKNMTIMFENHFLNMRSYFFFNLAIFCIYHRNSKITSKH